MRLEDIGFYTLSDKRAKNSSPTSTLSRCELVLSSRCNFKCPYCRHRGGKDMTFGAASKVVSDWAKDGLYAIRFSGGEPTLWPGLVELVKQAKQEGIKRIAISTNGSASTELYSALVNAGCNDFSVSFDACCAEDCEKMAGGIKGAFDTLVETLRFLTSTGVYVTVGIVLTEANQGRVSEIVNFAVSLGVSDIRIIPAAQDGCTLPAVEVDEKVETVYPILAYRLRNLRNNLPVRGLRQGDAHRCGLVVDDSVVNHGNHYPCIIYMREGGKPIGVIGEGSRQERIDWYKRHNSFLDPICSKNCLDVCVEYNNKFRDTNLWQVDEEEIG